mgnify:CR=1 FL=1
MRNYENERELTRALLDFLEKSPTSFHAVEQMRRIPGNWKKAGNTMSSAACPP